MGEILSSRGKSIVAATEARANAGYGLLTTPDRVSGLVLTADGLIWVVYQATWQESVIGAARAATFVGANQLKVQDSGAGNPATTAAMSGGAVANRDRPLVSVPGVGLVSSSPTVGVGSADVTTGQAVGLFTGGMATSEQAQVEIGGLQVIVPGVGSVALPLGGAIPISAAAGTYDISVQFKASSGSVTAKNRKLWAWVQAF